MEKKLLDYIQYYSHCDFYLTFFDRKTRITNIWPQQDDEYCVGYGYNDHNGVCGMDEIKPILRKLEDMTDGECLIVNDISPYFIKGTSEKYIMDRLYCIRDRIMHLHITPEVFHFCLRHEFDIFGLIESGLAIDAATLPK